MEITSKMIVFHKILFICISRELKGGFAWCRDILANNTEKNSNTQKNICQNFSKAEWNLADYTEQNDTQQNDTR